MRAPSGDTIRGVLLNRLLKYINLLVAVLLCIVLAVVYWFVYRVLPKTSGTIHAPLSAPATVTRDSLGVPHIQASSIGGRSVPARLRCGAGPPVSDGTAAEIGGGGIGGALGPVALEADRDARRFRMRRIAEEQSKRLDPKDRVWLAAYARGVNYFMETHQDALPTGICVAAVQTKPWSVVGRAARSECKCFGRCPAPGRMKFKKCGCCRAGMRRW